MGEKEELNKSLNVLAKSAFVVFFGVAISKIATYLYRVIIAREFGPEVYGTFSLAISLFTLILSISLLGFDSGIIRFIPLYRSKNKNKEEKYLFYFGLKSVFISSLVFGVAMFLVKDLIAINLFHNPLLARYLYFFSFIIPVAAIGAYLLGVINAYEKISLYSFIENIATNSFNVLFILIFLMFGLGSESVPLSYFTGTIATVAITYILIKKYLSLTFSNSDLEESTKKSINHEFTRYSIPLFFFAVVNLVMSWIDSFSIGYFKTAYEIGVYNAAVPIALLMNIAPQLFVKLFFPLITREYGKNNQKTIKELSKQVSKWIFLINLPIFIVIFLFPESLLNLFFGREYLSAAPALRVLVIGTFFSSTLRISDRLIAMIGKSKTLLLNILLALLLNLFLNAVLIPKASLFGMDNSSGLLGAAISTTISMFFLGIFSVYQSAKYTHIIPIRKKMLNFLVAAVISGAGLWLIKEPVRQSSISLIIFSVIFFIIYLSLAFLLKGLDRHDLETIRSFFKSKSHKNGSKDI